jgi:predicted nucleic acid-binding protein
LTVVANSSVLIALGSLGRLDLLERRFPEGILVPTAVWHEVVETGAGRAGAAAVATAKWITVGAVRDESRVKEFSHDLDVGESEALALALEKSAAIVLLDEKDARQMATQLGLAPLGTIGLLIWARRSGLIGSLRQQLDALRRQGKFRISQTLYATALRAVGEE